MSQEELREAIEERVRGIATDRAKELLRTWAPGLTHENEGETWIEDVPADSSIPGIVCGYAIISQANAVEFTAILRDVDQFRGKDAFEYFQLEYLVRMKSCECQDAWVDEILNTADHTGYMPMAAVYPDERGPW